MNRTRLLTSATIAVTMVLIVLVVNNFNGAGDRNAAAVGVSISGRVAAVEGPVPEGLWVRITGQQDGRVQSVTVPVQSDGTFTAGAIEPGFYTLRAARRSGADSPAEPELGSTTVMVNDADVTGLVLTLKPPAR